MNKFDFHKECMELKKLIKRKREYQNMIYLRRLELRRAVGYRKILSGRIRTVLLDLTKTGNIYQIDKEMGGGWQNVLYPLWRAAKKGGVESFGEGSTETDPGLPNS